MSRLILRPPPPLRSLRRRLPVSSPSRLLSSTFDPSPSPPRLPAAQQAEFERLQREAEARLSTHTTVPLSPPLQTSRHTTSPSPSASSTSPSSVSPPSQTQSQTQAQTQPVQEATPAAAAEGEATFSGGIRKGAPPEFEGETNPVTGEVGGPKNEPLRWGGGGDWSYNGRVTDF
ncbi:DUF1674-domain-containing protein [Coniochaeta ligniaria NRRL 30616]|uniref:Succinate dehydrogenase assembly factor 4, mitochondrial n=1 Tax=Coniochaeta ligniaria NRRL 30616 TaxID=1408157 RepID=A0A1J7J928_9PEZI|nr:DUF1674-domain-containing protein [Coniochaeta ligniaria NRRL 30616]